MAASRTGQGGYLALVLAGSLLPPDPSDLPRNRAVAGIVIVLMKPAGIPVVRAAIAARTVQVTVLITALADAALFHISPPVPHAARVALLSLSRSSVAAHQPGRGLDPPWEFSGSLDPNPPGGWARAEALRH